MLHGKGTCGHVNLGKKTELKLYLFPTTDYLTGPVVYGVSQRYFTI